jgi:hypothetical protein
MLALFTTVRKLTELQLAAIFEFHIDNSTSCSDALTAKERVTGRQFCLNMNLTLSTT